MHTPWSHPGGRDTVPRGFVDSRQLSGANRHFGGCAVVLVPRGPAADDGAAHGRWMAQVLSLCAALGWPPPQPRVHAHEAGVMLAFAAPDQALRTAAAVNEWAWERAAALHPRHAAAGFALAQPAAEDAVALFRARAQGERSRPLARLLAAAAEHGLPWLVDDDTLSIGEGGGSVVYARAALPLPLDVPWQRLHAVPKLLVGGAGKASTARLLAAMAAAAGFTPGLSGGQGWEVDGQRVAAGDFGGPAGARALLRHPRVTAAVLQTAPAAVLRCGLSVGRAEVAVLTAVGTDTLDEFGLDHVDDIAEAELVLAHAVQAQGTLVLDAGDETLMRAAARLPHVTRARWAVFARDCRTPVLAALRQHGLDGCAAREGRLLLWLQGQQHDLGALAEMPLGGAGEAQPEPLAAAALAAATLGWPLKAVRLALHTGAPAPTA